MAVSTASADLAGLGLKATRGSGGQIDCLRRRGSQGVPAIDRTFEFFSIAEHCPTLKIYLIFPAADHEFVSWISRHPQVALRAAALPTAYGVNVKPQAILHLLDEGHDDILWIDSDIIVTADLTKTLAGIDHESLLLTEEALWTPYGDPDGMRARMWGFKVGRVLPFALNTGVIRVTRQHYPLMIRWRELLDRMNIDPPSARIGIPTPPHDQRSGRAHRAPRLRGVRHVPLRILMRGKDIVQYFGPYGYTLRDAWFIWPAADRHSFIRKGRSLGSGRKGTAKRRSARNYLYDLYVELSP